MVEKPRHLRPEFAERFKDPEVAEAYRSRPPYPPETFQVLTGLIGDSERSVLDVGCGTGNIARPIAAFVNRVDAVDFSKPMIDVAMTLPGGHSRNITWRIGKMEEVDLSPPYSLIVGGQSLHWVDWDVAFPRFKSILRPSGYLAVVDLDDDSPWKEELQRLIAEFSTNPDYHAYDMVKTWQESGWVEKAGERRTSPTSFKQSVNEYVTFLHSMSSLTRNSMGKERASQFDNRVRGIVSRYLQGSGVELKIASTIAWGKLGREAFCRE